MSRSNSSRRRATFAPEDILASYQAEPVVTDASDELVFKGWRFKLKHDKICVSSDLVLLARSIENALGQPPSDNSSDDIVSIDGQRLHLPPMLFLNDIFSITHEASAVGLSWQAGDALKTWAQQHTTDYKMARPMHVVQVPYANAWINRSLGGARPQEYTARGKPIVGAQLVSKVWDWTFSSDYMCTLAHQPEPSVPAVAMEVCSAVGLTAKTASERVTEGVAEGVGEELPHSKWRWQRAASSGLNLDMLKATDVPILLFDESILYQDDLEDCGEVTFDVKMRVMPHCWFILSRMFVRVDGSIIRVRETRFFHAFSDAASATSTGATTTGPVVHVTVSWRELNLVPDVDSLLPAAIPPVGSPASPGHPAVPLPLPQSTSSSPTTTGAGNGGAPWGALRPQQMRNPAWIAERVPEVNAREGVHQYFTLTLA